MTKVSRVWISSTKLCIYTLPVIYQPLREVNLILSDTCYPPPNIKVFKNIQIWAPVMPSHALWSHYFSLWVMWLFSGWQGMALLCNSADKEWSNHSWSQMKCDLLCTGFSLTRTCWCSPALSLSLSLMWLRVKPSCCRTLEYPFVSSSPPTPPSPRLLSSTVCRLLYMWH